MTSDMTKKSAQLILLLSICLSFVVAFVFSWDRLGIQFSLSMLFAVLVIGYTSWQTKKKLDPFAVITLVLLAAISLFVSVRASPLMTFLNISFSLGALLVALKTITGFHLTKLKHYFSVLWEVPLASLASFAEVPQLANVRLSRSLTPTQTHVVRGVAIALPLLFVFGLLFAAADAVFADLFAGLVDIELSLSADVWARLIAFVSLFVLSAGGLAYAFLLKLNTTKASSKISALKERSIELSIVLGSLNALFLVFLIIQAAYLFGGREVVLDGGLTYAEYGRRGFFELLAVATLTFAIVYRARNYLQARELQWPRMLSLILIVQVGVVMISALKRLSLYEEVFGFTILRFYSHSFIFYLAAAFALLALMLVRRGTEQGLLRSLFVGFGVYLLILNVLSPDAFIARQNLDRFAETGKYDATYGSDLSVDAFEQKVEALQRVDDSETTTQLAELQKVVCLDQVLLQSEESWSTTNFAREAARDRIAELDTDYCAASSDSFQRLYDERQDRR